MLGFLLSILACEPMANPGNPFSDEPALSTVGFTANATEEAVAAVEASSSKDPINEPPKAEGDFADPQDSEPVYSSAEAAKNSTEATPEEKSTVNSGENNVVAETAAEVKTFDAETVPQSPEVSPSISETEANARLRPARIQDGWSPTLVSTIPSIPVPKAVITLPSGKDIVVQPGDILREEGVVIMSVGQDSVEIAIVSNAGGTAAIQNLTLHSQIKQAHGE